VLLARAGRLWKSCKHFEYPLDNRQTCLYHVCMARIKAEHSEAKQRLLETADRLFYKEGVRAVGIDKVIAEAEVAKMTLYTHFKSKDDLIVAVLAYREQRVLEFFQDAIERHSKKNTEPLRAFFVALKEWFETEDFRGCAFQNATIELANPEHEASQFVRTHKQRFTEIIRGLVEKSVEKGSNKLAQMIYLLVEGAVVTAVIQGSSQPADLARDAAFRLLATP